MKIQIPYNLLSKAKVDGRDVTIRARTIQEFPTYDVQYTDTGEIEQSVIHRRLSEVQAPGPEVRKNIVAVTT